MDNQSGNYHPQLKKIKRPLNRIAPQTSARSEDSANPFREKSPSEPQVDQSSPQSEIDKYLDEEKLPSKESNNQSFVSAATSSPQYIDEATYDEEVYGRGNTPYELPEWLTMKVFFLIVSVCMFVGVVIGKFIFAESKIVRNGLQGVVVNSEVPRGRARCGVAERTQGCVLYIMNPQRQDMRAKDFYDLAAQMTGRQRFMIETGNMRYANSKISPGDIVQLNIPPL